VLEHEGRRPLWELFAEGQVLELSGKGAGKLSVVARLIARAQQAGEVAAFIAPKGHPSFYAPDLFAMGIDLDALLMVRMSESAGTHGCLRAAEILLRSGAFGLVVIELGQGVPKGELSWQSRLTGLVRHHACRLLLITSTAAEAPSLGPLVSLRTEPHLAHASGGRVQLEQRVLKSKLGAAIDPSPDTRSLPVGCVA
jgi:recombination protein RecA